MWAKAVFRAGLSPILLVAQDGAPLHPLQGIKGAGKGFAAAVHNHHHLPEPLVQQGGDVIRHLGIRAQGRNHNDAPAQNACIILSPHACFLLRTQPGSIFPAGAFGPAGKGPDGSSGTYGTGQISIFFYRNGIS